MPLNGLPLNGVATVRQFILLAIGFAISRFHGRIRGVGLMEHRIDGNGCILYMEGIRPCGDDDQ